MVTMSAKSRSPSAFASLRNIVKNPARGIFRASPRASRNSGWENLLVVTNATSVIFSVQNMPNTVRTDGTMFAFRVFMRFMMVSFGYGFLRQIKTIGSEVWGRRQYGSCSPCPEATEPRGMIEGDPALMRMFGYSLPNVASILNAG